MRRTSTFIKKTRSGRLLTISKEHYLRDDIWCGSRTCQTCKMKEDEKKLQTKKETKQYFILDTNVLLHQMDLLETALSHCERVLFSNLIFLQTVLDEVRSNNIKLYTRVRTFIAAHPHAYVFCNEHHRSTYVDREEGESPNDRNDRAIRVATAWYKTHLPQMDFVLMTNDKENRQRAANMGAQKVQTISVPEYVDQYAKQYPDLPELLARMEAFEKDREKGAWTYPAHLSPAELKSGLDSGKLKKGTFKVNRDYWSEASVSIRGGDPLFIPDVRSMNRAIDGDIVVVEVLPRSQWKRPSRRLAPTMEEESIVNNTGSEAASHEGVDVSGMESATLGASGVKATARVVGIFKRNWRPYCGSLEVSSKKRGTVLFLSVNKRIPKIKISSAQIESLMDKRIMVQIDAWPAESKYPVGHYVKTLGEIGDKDTETQVLLIEHDIPTAPWSKSVLACLPKDEHNIDQSHCEGRSDFRGLEIYSIDPPGCTDIDDALHCRPLPNGNFELGVHIADVSHYVRPETAIDLEAANRGTSVYLVDKRIDMLPSKLSTNLCSLRSNIDRLTFSVLWEMTPDGNIVDTTFHKAVIRSVASFTYAQAQERLDSDATDSITVSCKNLRKFARILKQRRLDAGALLLASSEVKFLIDKQSNTPMDVEMYAMREANSVVEEFMLLANISVGKRILEYYPTFALLRRHPTPTPDMFEPLVRAGRAAGFDIKVDTSKHLAESLDKCVVPQFPFFNKLIRMMATRCMTQAIYFSSGDVTPKEYYHYGLACPVYTHFTSPIRRYADIVVHRLLASSLGIDPLPAAVQDRERVHDMAETINHRHRMAQLVSRASSELFTLLYFDQRDVTEDAMVVAVKTNGIRVMVPRFGLESAITLWHESEYDEEQTMAASKTSTASNNPWKLDEMNMTLTGPNNVRYKIFEQVRVRIYVKEGKNRRKWLQIDLLDQDATSSKPTQEIEQHLADKMLTTQQDSLMDGEEPQSTTTKASKKRERQGDTEDTENASTSPTPGPATSISKKKTKKAAAASTDTTATPGKQAKKKQKV